MAGKQDHLLAGKKKLEEFRKKKAAEKAKKTTFNGQSHPASADPQEKQFPKSNSERVIVSNGADTFNGVVEPSVKITNFESRTPLGSSNDGHVSTSYSANNYNAYSLDSFQNSARNEKSSHALTVPVIVSTSPYDKGSTNNHAISSGTSERLADGVLGENSMPSNSLSFEDSDGSVKHNNYRMGISFSNDRDTRMKDAADSSTSFVSEGQENTLLNKSTYINLRASDSRLYSSISNGDYVHHTYDAKEAVKDGHNMDTATADGYNQISEMSGRKLSSSVGHLTSSSSSFNLNESRHPSINFDVRSSTNQVPVASSVGTNTRRSRPSFLDSINTKVSLVPMPQIESQNADPFNFCTGAEVSSASQGSLNAFASSNGHSLSAHDSRKIVSPRPSFLDSLNTSNVSLVPMPEIEPHNSEPFNFSSAAHTSSASQGSLNAFASSNGHSLFTHDSRNNSDGTHSFYSTKQNEDFAALEQHIEDLTQEKFSLQRALEASRTLAESLASENSALTDSYNQQGGVIHQLRSDMIILQEEIKVHLVELESLKVEYANAQLECNAADERANLLASEVIGLEEKSLRLRSSELRLERQLEDSQAEISSLRKKFTSVEKDRQDLQMMINALQEEKKLLQSKLRKASTSEKFSGVSKSPNLNKKNASTTTEDLVNNEIDSTEDASNHEMQSAEFIHHSDGSSAETRQYSLEGLSFSVVPPDQMRMIGSINTLISELALEKEELVHALSAESSQSSKLKDLNKELSRKLEIQTQRLELLAAQSMASDSIPAKQPDSFIIPENSPYADEGDEVVERVLGWIMKLFPGGPSRRRTSKLL